MMTSVDFALTHHNIFNCILVHVGYIVVRCFSATFMNIMTLLSWTGISWKKNDLANSRLNTEVDNLL